MDDETAETLDFEELKEREQRKREATKEFVLEYGDGARAVFEYQMIDGVDEIIKEHTVRRPTRSGQEDEREVENEYALARDVFAEGIVDAPAGFKITQRALREDITDELMDDLFEAIVNFSRAEEITVRKFRGIFGGE